MPDYLSREVLREISCFLNLYAVRPAAYISYKRLAFTGKEDPTLRVTFDREICTRREQLLLEAGLLRRASDSGGSAPDGD